jgi:hypothetical protein
MALKRVYLRGSGLSGLTAEQRDKAALRIVNQLLAAEGLAPLTEEEIREGLSPFRPGREGSG